MIYYIPLQIFMLLVNSCLGFKLVHQKSFGSF